MPRQDSYRSQRKVLGRLDNQLKLTVYWTPVPQEALVNAYHTGVRGCVLTGVQYCTGSHEIGTFQNNVGLAIRIREHRRESIAHGAVFCMLRFGREIHVCEWARSMVFGGRREVTAWRKIR